MGEHAMNIAVCDDQPEVLDVVENMLREIPEVERVETYQDIRHMRDGLFLLCNTTGCPDHGYLP